MITLTAVSLKYSVRNVDCVLPDGEVTYLLGLNGVGKTSLLRAIAGVVRPVTGSITISEAKHTLLPGRNVGMSVSADAFKPNQTGRRHLSWVAALCGMDDQQVEMLIDAYGLSDFADQLIRTYSLGMRQRLAIAAALVGDPQHILLDEPLNGLDVEGVEWMRGLVRSWAEQGRCVLIASHNLDEITRSGDKILLFSQGSAQLYSLDMLLEHYSTLEAAFHALNI